MGDRWLGPRHARRVAINPLHHTARIESCITCIRCEQQLHRDAFRLASGGTVKVCLNCRKALLAKHDRNGGLP